MEKAITDVEYHKDSPIKRFLVICGIFFVIQMGFAIFGVPRTVSDWLRCSDINKIENPQWIIILGGSGVPSPSTLIRSYYGAYCALAHPDANCIVALPTKVDPETGSPSRMRHELVLRGVNPARIKMEYHGMNTHQQALNIAKMIKDKSQPIIVVTSPYHMRRAYLCFKKAGFKNIGCLPANSTGGEKDYEIAQIAWSGVSFDIGHAIGRLRYGIWSNMTAQIWMSRELLGIMIYKLRGWI